MRIYKTLADISPAARGAVVAIGNFDGIHRGHRKVMRIATRIAASRNCASAVLTFEPHPRQFFQPDTEPFRLTPLMPKARRIAALGIDSLFVAGFDQAFSQVSAESFVMDILLDRIGATHVVVGYDFVFGHNRAGNLQMLREICATRKVGVTVVDAAAASDGTVYSSSRIRGLIADGEVAEAARLLGDAWEIEGMVVEGDKRGRQIGFPTANIPIEGYLHPKLGVYAVRVGLADAPEAKKARDGGEPVISDTGGLPKTLDAEAGEGAPPIGAGPRTDKPSGGWWRWVNGIANIGVRPTVGGSGVRVEAHLFDFNRDLYGQTLRVALVDFIREERKFDGIEALKTQIAVDCDRARQILAPGHAAILARAAAVKSAKSAD